MKKPLRVGLFLLFGSGCVGIIDNAGIDDDGGGATISGVATGGTTVSTSGIGAGGSAPGAPTATTNAGTGGVDPSASGAGGATGAPTGPGGVAGNGAPPATGTGGSPGSSTAGGTAGSGAPDGGLGGASGGTRPDAGSVGNVIEGGTAGATYAEVRAIVQRRCGPCHGNFATYATFTTHRVGNCGNDTLAKANDPANSGFLELVQGQCGTFLMPRGCRTAPCIPTTEIQTVTSWVNAGALNN